MTMSVALLKRRKLYIFLEHNNHRVFAAVKDTENSVLHATFITPYCCFSLGTVRPTFNWEECEESVHQIKLFSR
jgi:hypothetical protein